MNRRSFRQGFTNGILIILLICFLLVFLRTCFHQPETVEPQKSQPVEQITPQVETVIETKVEEKAEPTVPPQTPSRVEQEPTPSKPLPTPIVELPHVQVTHEIPVPAVPASVAITVKAMVPDIPNMATPTVISQEDYDLFYAPQAEQTDEKDPFADFVVSGEEESVTYDDGLYYLSLYVNDEYLGDIETKFANPAKLLNTKELNNFIGGMLKTEANARLFSDNLEYLSLEELAARGLPTRFDSTAFALYMTIDYNDLSVRVLSVTSTYGSRRDRYALSGAIELPPAKFSWVASLSLYGTMTYPSDFSSITNKSATLYVSNALGFLGIGLNFSNSFYTNSPYYSIGTWTAFHDFVEDSQRLTFGSVGSNLSARTTSTMSIDTNIGFSVEKSYSYGTNTALSNQFQYSIDVIEPSMVKIYINDQNKEVFSRHLVAGTYRLKDFIFTQGANKIRIDVIPDARPDNVETYYVDTSYDSRLLGKGDTLFGYGVSIPRGNDSSSYGGAFHFRDPLRQSYLSYYPQYFTARYWQSVGLTDTFTMALDVSATPGVFSGTVNGVWANLIGTTQFQGTTRFSEAYTIPLFNGTITERFNDTVMHGIGSLSLSTSFITSASADTTFTPAASDVSASVVGSLAFSSTGLLTKLRYSVSGSTTYVQGNQYPTWSVSGSTGFSPLRGLSLSGSMTVSGSDSDKPWNATVSATISGSYSFSSKVNASASTTIGTDSEATTSLGLSYRPNNTDSLSLSLSSFKFSSPLNHTLLGSWSHTGKFYNMTLRQQVSSNYRSLTTSANLTTAIAFADGVFGLGRSVSDNFLLIKPEGELKKSQIAVARSMDSSPQIVQKYFGTSLFNNLTSYQKNNVVVYGGGESAYSTSSSFMYQFTPNGRQAYVVKIDLPPTFTVTGVIKHADGTVYEQYSSPVYSVTYDETGKQTLKEASDYYLFTDQEGRFVINSMPSGEYSFDLQVSDNTWYAVKFTIPAMGNKKLRAIEYAEVNDAGPFDEKGFDDYDKTMTLVIEKQETEEELYSMLFPVVQ